MSEGGKVRDWVSGIGIGGAIISCAAGRQAANQRHRQQGCQDCSVEYLGHRKAFQETSDQTLSALVEPRLRSVKSKIASLPTLSTKNFALQHYMLLMPWLAYSAASVAVRAGSPIAQSDFRHYLYCPVPGMALQR